MNLNDKISMLRRKQGMSQEEFGEKIYVSRQSVSKWEMGESKPKTDQLIRIAKVFEITLDELLEDNSDNNSNNDNYDYYYQEKQYNIEYETICSVNNVITYKGRKPLAVKIGDTRIITPTWKSVVKTVLKEVLKQSDMRERIFYLRDRLLGTKRKKLSSTADGMYSPLKLEEGLYIEMNYNAETLMNLLIEILNEISYNYDEIKIVIKNQK